MLRIAVTWAQHGGKVNDLVLCLAAGGLRALLTSRGEPVDGVWLLTAIAVSLRTMPHDARAALGTTGAADSADRLHHADRLHRDPGRDTDAGNRTGGFVVRLPLGEPDPGRRLDLVRTQTRLAKRNQLVTTGNGLLMWLARLGLARTSAATSTRPTWSKATW